MVQFYFLEFADQMLQTSNKHCEHIHNLCHNHSPLWHTTTQPAITNYLSVDMNSKILKAVCNRDCNGLRTLLKDDSERMKILAKDPQGKTVLMIAAENIDPECLKILMELPEARQLVAVHDKKGLNIIHYLCLASKKNPESEVWTQILTSILHLKESSSLFHDRTVEGNQNILHFAAMQSSSNFLKTLLKHSESRRAMKETDSLDKVPVDYAFNKEIRKHFTH